MLIACAKNAWGMSHARIATKEIMKKSKSTWRKNRIKKLTEQNKMLCEMLLKYRQAYATLLNQIK